MPRYDYAAAVAGPQENNVTPRLMVYRKAGTFQCPDDLALCYSWQVKYSGLRPRCQLR